MLSLTIKPDMVGHKLGEFSITKKLGREIHLKEKGKKKKKR
jgi:ribosomal protein S19